MKNSPKSAVFKTRVKSWQVPVLWYNTLNIYNM
jgi:hypothetical protein